MHMVSLYYGIAVVITYSSSLVDQLLPFIKIRFGNDVDLKESEGKVTNHFECGSCT